MSEASDHRNPRVLISGAASGVGLTCAELLAQSGAELILCDTDVLALAAAATRLGAFTRYCDAIDEYSVAIFAAEVAESFSTIDVLINAAGSGYVRTLSTMRITRAIMPLLRRSAGKRLLLNIHSTDDQAANGRIFPYASSLPALERLSEVMVEQTRGTGIEVVNITPRSRVRLAAEAPRGNLPSQLRRTEADQAAAQVLALIRAARGPMQLGPTPAAGRAARRD